MRKKVPVDVHLIRERIEQTGVDPLKVIEELVQCSIITASVVLAAAENVRSREEVHPAIAVCLQSGPSGDSAGR